MASKADLSLRHLGNLSVPGSNSNRRMQELWLMLAKLEWTSLAVLPASPTESPEALARSLAAVGKNLTFDPVSAVTVKVLGPNSALALAALANHVRNRSERFWKGNGVIEVTTDLDNSGDAGGYMVTTGRLILGIPPVVSEPVSLAVAHAADRVLLVVNREGSLLSDVKRSVDLIGRNRIIGCCVV